MLKTCLSALLILAAAQQPSQPQPKPGFTSSVTVVEVDVVVTDKSGRLVRGLRQQDFAIAEDGRPVEIASFSALDAPAASADALMPPPDQSGSAFAANERSQDGRLVLIVLDDVQIGFTAGRMKTVKQVARRAVERLGPDDVAGVMMTSGRSSAQTEFTTDRARLLAAIDRFMPQGEHDLPDIASGLPTVDGAGSATDLRQDKRTYSAITRLTGAARTLGTIPHRRKGVLLISQGFPRIGDTADAIREFMLTAQRHNIAVYTVDPCGLETDAGCTRTTRQNLRSMAEETGGFATINSNAPDAAVDRMLAETGTYYLLGYYSPAAPNDGKRHRISVTTRVPDVEIRAREGYESPSRTAKAVNGTPLELLTGSAIQTAGLTMRVVAIPTPLATAPSAAVIVGIELPTIVATRAGRVDFAVTAIDQEGKARSRVRFTTRFSRADTKSSSWTRTGSRIDLPPGDYQLRVAAVGGDKTQGSVYLDVSVPKFDGNVGVGGLSLGAASAVAVTEADRLRGVLTLIPLATNDLAPGVPVEGQIPIRVDKKLASSPLTITSMLVREDGTTLPLDRTEATGRDYAGAGGKVYRVALPATLAAGRYRLAVEISLGRTTVARDLGFSVLP